MDSKLTKGQKTSEAILEATCNCIAELGIEKTSITAIAKRARVSRALVAHYFPKKSEIFRHVIEYVMKRGYSAIEAKFSDDPRAQLVHMVDQNLRYFLDHPAYFSCFYLFYYFASIDAKYRRMNTVATRRAVARIEDNLNKMRERDSDWNSRHSLSEQAESIHRELIGAIQKFYIVTHSVSKTRYREEHLKLLNDRLDDLLSD